MNIKICAAFGWLFVPFLTMAGPSRIMDLSAISTNGGTVLTWTAPTPSGVTTLSSIDVRYDTSPITTLNWASKTRVAWLTSPGTPHTVQTATVTSLTPNTTYYFAIKVQDSTGSWSTMSNLAMVSTGGATYTVILAWDPSMSSSVSSYNIYVGTASATYTNVISTGNVTLGTVTGLVWGVTYYYAATAVDTNGLETDFSNEISYKRP